jgi:hypothetical protein
VGDGRESLAGRTDDELFEAEITHCVCRGSLGLGLNGEGEVSATSTSQNDICHHFERCFAPSSLSLVSSPLIVLDPSARRWLAAVQLQAGNLRNSRSDVPSLVRHLRAD